MKILGNVDISRYAFTEPVEGGEYTGFKDNFIAGYQHTESLLKSNSERSLVGDMMRPLVEKIQEEAKFENYEMANYLSDPTYYKDDEGKSYTGTKLTAKRIYDYAQQNASYKQFLSEQGYDISTPDNLHSYLTQQAADEAEAKYDHYNKVSRKRTGLGTVGDFAGSMVSHMTDPLDAATLLIPIGSSLTVVKQIGAAVATNVGVELLEYPQVRSWHQRVTGEDYSPLEFAQNTGIIAIGTAGLVGALNIPMGSYLNAVSKKINRALTPQEEIEAINAFKQAHANREGYEFRPDQTLETALNKSEADKMIQENSFISNDNSNTKHNGFVLNTLRNILNDDLRTLEKGPTAGLDAPSSITSIEKQFQNVETIASKDIVFDEAQYQFKVAPEDIKPTQVFEYVDESGNTITREIETIRAMPDGVPDIVVFKRKAGQEQTESISIDQGKIVEKQIFDPVQSGHILVYEDRNGVKTVVDGHQRLKLAQAENADVQALVLREVDGFTPEMGKVSSMVKNFYEGTISKADLPKYKKYPDLVDLIDAVNPQLKAAQGLVNLAPKAYMAMYHNIVGDDIGSLVGQSVLGEQRQLAMMDILKKQGPINIEQARQVIKETLDNNILDTYDMESLAKSFQALNYIPERKMMVNQIIQDLETENFRLKNEGAKLPKDSDQRILNDARRTQNEKTIKLIRSYGNQEGEIADIITDGARAYKDAGNVGLEDFARTTADDIRKGVDEGHFDRLSNSAELADRNLTAKINQLATDVRESLPELAKYFDAAESKGVAEDISNIKSILDQELENNPNLRNLEIDFDADGNPIRMSQILDDVAERDKNIEFIRRCQQ